MAIQIPFPLPSHGYALNSRMIVNLQYLVDQFNSFNTGTSSWDSVTLGTGSSITGVLKFFNSSNNFYLAIQPGVTGADVTYTLPITAPSNNSLLLSSGSDVLSWSSVGASSFLYSDGSRVPTWSAITATSLVTFNSSKVPAYISLSGTANTLLALNGSGTLTQTIPYNVTGASVGLLYTAAGVSVDPLTNSQGAEGFVTVSSVNFPTIKTLLGTTSQVTVTKNTNDWTLSLPQNINTAANVQFGSVVVADGSSSAPGFSFSSQTTLGFTRTASDQITVYGSTGTTIAVLAPSQVRIGGNLLVTAAKGLILEGTSFNTTIKAATSPSAAWTLTLPVDGGTNNYVLTTNGSGVTSWASVSSTGGATKALDNLASTAVNTDLLPGVDNTSDLGNGSFQWRQLYISSTIHCATYQGVAANPATAGLMRLSTGDSIAWRNNANGGNILLSKDTSDNLQWNSTKILLSGAVVNADINGSAAIALSKLAALTTSRALQSNASTGAIEVSSVTNTELGFVSGVTSAIQTQLGTKAPLASPTFTGTVTAATLDAQTLLKGKGTATNDNATSGYIGEYIESYASSNTQITASATAENVTSISLTAGDWDVQALHQGDTGTGCTLIEMGISSDSTAAWSDLSRGKNATFIYPVGGTANGAGGFVRVRVSLASTTTYYFKIRATYSTTAPFYRGTLAARRVR